MRICPIPRASRPVSFSHSRLITAVALALMAGGVHANDNWQASGDVRFGYVASETRARSGAETDAEADLLLTTMQQSFARLRMNQPGLMPPPVKDIDSVIPAPYLAQANAALAISATGGRQRLRDRLAALIEAHQPDEVILTGHVFDHAARLRSYEMAAEAMRDIAS